MPELTTNSESATECPVCDSHDVHESWQTEVFRFGETDDISVELPTLVCRSCEFMFTDQRAEVLRHEAVCKHQNLLTPSEIIKVRKDLQMSRREFALAFGIPRASMDRWETGKQIQNTSLDSLLRALQNKATAARLDRRKASRRSEPVVVQFPALAKAPEILHNAQERAEGFMLRACAR